MSAEKTYTEAFIADLAAFLANPPEPPPEPKKTLAQVLDAVRPQIVALKKAGYAPEQIRAFLVDKGIPVDNKTVSNALGLASRPAGKSAAKPASPKPRRLAAPAKSAQPAADAPATNPVAQASSFSSAASHDPEPQETQLRSH